MAPKDCFLGVVRRRTIICCRNVKISASIAARDRNRSTTAQTMSLKRSLITDQHLPILGIPPSYRFSTGTGDLQSAEEYINTSNLHSETNSLGPLVAAGRARKGQLAISRGDVKDGVATLRSALKEIHAVRYELLTTE